jgi:D-tyrosyl-tRNA(Tyr) deacylase
LRIFPDENEKMNLSIQDIGGEVLAVSQFTLAGSIKKGRRPSFDNAEDPGRAQVLFDYFVEEIKNFGVEVKTGVFAAFMQVPLVNEGPVTFVIEKRRNRKG